MAPTCKEGGCLNFPRSGNARCDECLVSIIKVLEESFLNTEVVLASASRELLRTRHVQSGGFLEIHCDCGYTFLGEFDELYSNGDFLFTANTLQSVLPTTAGVCG